MVRQCRSQQRCQHCQRKHHTLLHEEEDSVRSRQRAAPEAVSLVSSCLKGATITGTLLMTAVVEAVGRRKVATRVFLDPGAQASFVLTALVDAMEARQLGTADVTLQAFGAQPQTTRMNVRQLQLIGTDGRLHDIEAFERKNLNITISRVPPEIVQRWGERGVYISDCCNRYWAGSTCVARSRLC